MMDPSQLLRLSRSNPLVAATVNYWYVGSLTWRESLELLLSELGERSREGWHRLENSPETFPGLPPTVDQNTVTDREYEQSLLNAIEFGLKVHHTIQEALLAKAMREPPPPIVVRVVDTSFDVSTN